MLALIDNSDQWHDAAESAWVQVVAKKEAVITTSLVLVECANAAARRPYRTAVVSLRESLARSGAVIEPTHTEWELAWRNYARRGGQCGCGGSPVFSGDEAFWFHEGVHE